MDIENKAATASLKACRDLLLAQQEAQPEAYPQISSGVLAAAELRFEVAFTIGMKCAHVRIAAIGADGEEDMLVRALDLAPPSGALQ